MKCCNCNGKGCQHCKDGWEVINGCPHKITGDIVDALPLFDLASKGAMPVSGGVLDQAEWFVEAFRFYANQVEYIKSGMP